MAISLDKTTCPNCGNKLTFNPETQALGCELCEQVSDIQEDYTETMAYNIIPFQISKSKAEDAFLSWLVRDEATTPADIIENTHIDFIQGLYLPAWLFGVWDKKQKTKFKVLGYAGELMEQQAELLQLFHKIQPQIDLVKPYEEKYAMGFEVKFLGTQKGDAWVKYMELSGEKAMSYQLQDDILFTYVPVWAITYSYKGTRHWAYIDGIRGDLGAGTAPQDQTVLQFEAVSKKIRLSENAIKISLAAFCLIVLLAIFLNNSKLDKLAMAAFWGAVIALIYRKILYYTKNKGIASQMAQIRKRSRYALSIRLAEKNKSY